MLHVKFIKINENRILCGLDKYYNVQRIRILNIVFWILEKRNSWITLF